MRKVIGKLCQIRLAYYVHALGVVYVCGIVVSINGWN